MGKLLVSNWNEALKRFASMTVDSSRGERLEKNESDYLALALACGAGLARRLALHKKLRLQESRRLRLKLSALLLAEQFYKHRSQFTEKLHQTQWVQVDAQGSLQRLGGKLVPGWKRARRSSERSSGFDPPRSKWSASTTYRRRWQL
jgi:hypothetical protein